MALSVIYIPGLGDNVSLGQPVILSGWRLFGLKIHYFPLGWGDKEKFGPKLQRLLNKVDQLQKQGNKVSLVGVSAGASAVLNAYANRKNLTAVVCIVGKINHPETIGPQRYIDNPAFKDSILMVKGSLAKLGRHERSRIMSIHPLTDETVPVADTIIPGAFEVITPTNGHVFSIFYTIVFKSRTIAKFLKEQAKK